MSSGTPNVNESQEYTTIGNIENVIHQPYAISGSWDDPEDVPVSEVDAQSDTHTIANTTTTVSIHHDNVEGYLGTLINQLRVISIVDLTTTCRAAIRNGFTAQHVIQAMNAASTRHILETFAFEKMEPIDKNMVISAHAKHRENARNNIQRPQLGERQVSTPDNFRPLDIRPRIQRPINNSFNQQARR